jgi:bis(5'-nucleosyl)-tetraphosphatase (symmetrical)
VSTYAIGDIQGCYDELRRLLDQFQWDPGRDRLWLAGDLVNRGPKSLQVLEFAYANRNSVMVVLGNHDLHLLNRIAGVSSRKKRDTLGPILNSDRRDELADWLRTNPLILREGDLVMVHAGIMPSWDWPEVQRRARKVQAGLQSDEWEEFLRSLKGGETEEGETVAALTRLRMLDKKGRPAWGYAGPPEEAPGDLKPWFAMKDRKLTDATILFGHWAALGHRMMPSLIALDSACVWGNKLTAVRLEDRAVFQVKCKS